MDTYAVIGNPIAHSLSPRIHGLFAEQTGESLQYRALLSPADEFAERVAAFRQAGGRGLNVTLPFKEQAWAYINHSSARADRARAANLIRFDADGRVFGDSTDGVGLVRDLHANGMQLRGRRVLLVGAGGAVRSVLGNVLDEQPAAVTIINRTPARARQLLKLFPEARDILRAQGFDEPADGPYNLVINGAAAGLAGQPLPLPSGILAVDSCCYDIVYGKAAQAFLSWAADNGAARLSDGLGMLVEQAAESFYLWRGIRPETQPVINALR
ncbi:MAG: shikimate dehydrogenase [Gammaproteobacteria bacterium]|nr:shikimate dehydrogenase [Gammaproteobacteria bacterium]MCY4338102.1 shikimate dehydrogenase [Gammaproteobacteria bacterium]